LGVEVCAAEVLAGEDVGGFEAFEVGLVEVAGEVEA
jgi:hypothetical protein